MLDYQPQLHAIISHAVSQLSYKWLPLPHHSSNLPMRIDAHELSLDDWHRHIVRDSERGGGIAWIEVLRRCNLSPIGVATVIYDNLRLIRDNRARLIDFYDAAYPQLLRHIPDPPNCLTVMGATELLHSPALALIGSRKASAFAIEQTRRLALQISQKGGVVVSGGAIGCDAAAHAGAMHSSILPIPTIIVLAGGLGQLYPRCLMPLFSKLKVGGALFVSERLWDFPARPFDFPVRNRIIAGLSRRVLVMQAAEKSGALHTAAYALDQGRDVYALVHEDGDVRARGSQLLIEQGACPFLSNEDFMSIPFTY